MSKQGLLSYITIMSMLFAVSVGYNACSEKANFKAENGFDNSEINSETPDNPTSTPQAVPAPSIVINDGAEFTREREVNLTLSTGSVTMREMFVSNDEYCRSGDWEPFQANKAWQLDQTNAEADVYVMYRNEPDDIPTACVRDGIIHDDIAPEVAFVTQVNNGWVSVADMEVEFTASDNLSGINLVWCAQNGNGVFAVCRDKMDYQAMSENINYELLVEAIDKAGNRSPKVPLNWNVDLTPPTVSFTLTPATTTADITPDFAYTGFDAGSGIAGYECRLDNAAAYTACPATQTLSGLADGPHSLVVRAQDNVGFYSDPITHNWVQDTSAPTVEFIMTPDAISNSSDATFGFQGLDGGVAINSFECSLDGAAFAACTSPRALNNLNDGNHSFSVIGIDGAGNRSAVITYNWLIDTQKPNIEFVQTPEAVTNEVNANFQVNAADNPGGSGIAFVECQIDGGGYQQCNNAFDFQNLAEGNHTVTARSVDRAGNVSDVISYSWMIDTTKPTVQITSTPNNPTNLTDADFEFVGNDGNGSGIAKYECRVDGANYADCNSPESYSGLSEGAHTFYVRAYDNAGNMSDAATYQWTIDTTGPVIAFVKQPPANVFVGNNAEILFRIDDDSGVASYSCTLNNQPQACTIDVQLDLVMDAVNNYSFTVVATDNVGNSSSQTVTWSSTFEIMAKAKEISVQDVRPVDILFVVDVSGSMDAERSNLAQRIEGFLEKVDGLDWQIGVISTDVRADDGGGARDGKLVEIRNLPGQFILDSSMDMALAQTHFGNTVQNIRRGDGNEQGIWATKRAIDRFINGDATHQQFFRDGADLSVVVLSDEDENSQGTNVRLSPQGLLDFVTDTWSGQKNFTWHSIITKPGDTQCLNAQSYAFYGDVYDELSRLTGFGQPGGAIIGSVCEQDYTAQLADIGQSVRDMQKVVTLECEPVDTDGDGVADISVEYQALGASSYSSYSGLFTVQALQMVFDDFLPPGDFKINYSCVIR